LTFRWSNNIIRIWKPSFDQISAGLRARVRGSINGVHDMKKPMILVILFSILGFSITWSQENGGQNILDQDNTREQDYIKLLYEGSQEDMLAAVAGLSELGSKGDNVIEALVFGLQQGTLHVKREYGKVTNDFSDVRAASAKLLGEIGDPRALPGLYIALRYDHDPHVKNSAAHAIGILGRNESIEHLARTIKAADTSGADDKLIISCIEAIGEIGGPDGFRTLVEILRGDYRQIVKMAARVMLKKIPW